MLTFICGMVGLVYSANLFSLYLNWEAMGLCSFSLVGFWYKQSASVAGARKVLLMTHLAGYGLLAAILLIYARTGSALWDRPRSSPCLYRRRVYADAHCAAGEVGSVPTAHLDSRSDERAYAGQRAAARGLLCEGRRLSGRADALL